MTSYDSKNSTTRKSKLVRINNTKNSFCRYNGRGVHCVAALSVVSLELMYWTPCHLWNEFKPGPGLKTLVELFIVIRNKYFVFLYSHTFTNYLIKEHIRISLKATFPYATLSSMRPK